MGLDMHELNGIIGAVTAATKQSGNEVGNFVKASLPRLLGAPAQKALDSLNISLTDQEGNLRNIIQVYSEVAERIKTITDAERMAVVEGLAGKFHISRMDALLSDLGEADSMYRSMEESSRDAAGSAIEENEQYMKSLSARMQLARVEVEKLALSIGDAFLTEGMITGIRVFSDGLGIVTKLTESVGALPVAFGVAGVAALLLSTRFRNLTTALLTGTAGMTKAKVESIGMATNMTRASVATQAFSLSLRSLMMASGVGIALGVVGFAIEKIAGSMTKQREIQESMAEENRELARNYIESGKEIDELVTKYKNLQETMSTRTEMEQAEKAGEYLEVQNRLAELMPNLVQGEDAYGNAVLGSSTVIENKIKLLERQIEVEERRQALENEEKSADNQKALEQELKKNDLLIEEWLRKANRSTRGLFQRDQFHKEIESFEDIVEAMEYYEGLRDEYSKKREGSEAKVDAAGASYAERRIKRLKELATEYSQFTDSYTSAEASLAQISFESTEKVIANNDKLSDSAKELATGIASTLSVVGIENEALKKTLSSITDGLGDGQMLNFMVENFVNVMGDFKKAQADGVSTEDLEKYLKVAFSAFGIIKEQVLQAAEANGVLKSSIEYKELTAQLNGFANANILSIQSVEDMAKATGLSIEEVKNLIVANSEGEISLEDFEDAADSAAESTYRFKDAIEELAGVYQQQIDDTENLVWQYETLSAQLEFLEEGTREYAQTNDKLTAVKEQLLAIYPDLLQAGKISEAMTYDEIEAIKKEMVANDLLLAAYKASMDGKLTADETRAMSGLKFAKAEIQNINEIIGALNTLAGSYGAHGRGLDMASKLAFITPGQSAMALSLKTASIAFDDLSKKAPSMISKYEANLATLEKTQAGYIDTLKQSEAVLGNTTTRGNKALADKTKAQKGATKAQKEAAKAMETSIFLVDKYKRALEELTLEIKKQQDLQSKLAPDSPDYRKALEGEIKLQREKLALQQAQAKALEQQIASGKVLQTGVVTTSSTQTISPAGFGGRITSGYGRRNAPTKGASTNHQGIDIAGAKGSRLDANVSGKVIFAGNKGNGLGNYVQIQAEDGMKHIYAHLDKVVAKLGQTITAGMQIGNIGMTGTATGSHLHYQVNDASGKSINPQKYVDEARKGISVTSKETAQVQQDIDGLRSQLLSLNGEIIDQKALIEKLQLDDINSHLDAINAKRQQHQRTIEYEDEKIKSLDLSSKRYIATLNLQSKAISGKQKYNLEELAYINKLIDSGKLSDKVLAEMKIRADELATSILNLTNELKSMTAARIDVYMLEHQEGIDKINYEYQRLQAIMGTMEEGTAEYISLRKESIDILKDEQQAVLAQRNHLQKLIMSQGLHAEDIKKYAKDIEELTLKYWGLEGAIGDTNKALEDSNKALADDLVNAYKEYLGEKRDMHLKSLNEESKLEDERHKRVMDNYKKELEQFRKIIQERIDAIDREESERDYNKEIDKLEEERLEILNRINLLSLDDSHEAKAERKKLQEDLDRIDETIEEKRHKREVELRKENLNDILNDKEEQIKEEERLENERHDEEKKRIDDLKEYWEQHYTDLLNDERKFAEIRKQIAAGNFDAISKEFQEYIKEMKETMPDLENTLDGTMEAVGTSIRKNIIDRLKEALDLLGKVQGDPSGGGTGSGSGVGTGDSEDKRALSSGDLKVLAGKFMTDMLAPEEKKLASEEKRIDRSDEIRRKAHLLAGQGRAEDSTISASVDFNDAIKDLSDEDKKLLGEYLQKNSSSFVMSGYLQDLIRNYGRQLSNSAARLKTGGLTPSWGTDAKWAMLDQNELIFPENETKKFFDSIPIFDRLHSLLSLRMSNTTPPTLANSSGGDTIEINFNVDKLMGTEKEAKSFSDTIMDNLKRKRGIR